MPAQPETYAIASGEPLGAGCFVAPDWAPVAGEIKQISHAAGYFGTNGGATLAEITPANQAWNPNAPSIALYGDGAYYWGSITVYGGAAFNTDTREVVLYGAGHSAINVCAPFCFSLDELRWRWLDTPLPFDGFSALLHSGKELPASQADTELYYPPEQYNYAWGELQGGWSGWPAGYGRPGKIFPVPGHSFTGLVHLPASVMGNAKGGLLYAMEPSGILTGSNAKSSHVFDYDTATWSRCTNQPAYQIRSSTGQAYDPVTKKAFAFGSSGPISTVMVFDPLTRTWSTRTSSNSVATSVGAPGNYIHEKSRLYLCVGARDSNGNPGNEINGVTFDFYGVSLDLLAGTDAFSFTKLTVSAVTTWPLNSIGYNSRMGWGYCPVDGCLYCITGQGGADKYWKLAPPVGAVTQADYLAGTWTLTEHTFSSGAVVSSSGQSYVYNRLKWDVKSRAFIYFPDSGTDPVQAFRPHGV